MLKKEKLDTYSDVAKQMTLYEERVESAIKREVEKIKKEDPEFSNTYGMRNNVSCYKKRPKGYYKKVIDNIMMYLLMEGGVDRTQKDILQDVRDRLPEFEKILDNVWQKPLQKWEIEQVTRIIDGNMKQPLDIKGCHKLSEIRKRLKIKAMGDSKRFTFRPTIKINKDTVSIGKNIYQIEMRAVGAYTYPCIRLTIKGKRVWFRMDYLVEFLKK